LPALLLNMLVSPRDDDPQFMLEAKPGTSFSCARQLSFLDSGRDGSGVYRVQGGGTFVIGVACRKIESQG